VVVPAIATAKSGVTYTYAFDVTGGAGNGVYTSSNRGQSWKLKTSQDVTPKFSIAEMVVNPLSPTHAFFAQAEGPFEYTWGSSSVATVTSRDNSSPQFGDWRALSFGPAAHSTHALYGGTDGGPVAYNLNTRTYWNQSAGLIAGIDYYGAASSAKSEVSGAQDLGVDTYRGGPVHEVYHADAYGIVIDRSNSHIYYAGVNGPGGEGYQVSRDAGVSWKAVRLPGPAAGAPFGPRSEQATGDSKVIILPEPNSTLYITKNDGNSWSARTVGSLGSDGDYISSVRAATISGASVPVLYVGTAFGRLWKSTNLGANWTELSMQFGMTVKDIAIDAAHSSGPSAERVFVALGASAPEAYATSSIVGDVQETTDSGADWTDIGQSLQHISVNGLLLDSPNLLAATDYGVQVYSGGTWSKAGTGFPNVRVNDIFESWDHKAFFATTYGRGTWMSPAS